MYLDRGDHIIQALEHGQIDAALHCDFKTLAYQPTNQPTNQTYA